MSTIILGISAFYHDSAAALVRDGEIVAAAQEERFTRRKHDADFPARAVEYCLREADCRPEDLDYVAFYERPLLKFDRLLETYIGYAPAGFRSFCQAMPRWLRQNLHLPRVMDRAFDGRYRGPYVFTEHHESHAASAFFPSPFAEAAILTLDGVGEWATTCYGMGRGNRIALTHEIRFPHSLGLLYSAFTYYCGFRVNSGEYKLMGLAPYGEPRYAATILERMVDLKPDGSFRLAMGFFDYCHGLTMTSEAFHALFGAPPRRPESPLRQLDMDLAASVQLVTEEIMLRAARHLYEQTRLPNLVLAGGVALNCVGNGRILREGPYEQLWIQPGAGDAGGSLGAALFVWHQLLGNPRLSDGRDRQRGSFLGPAFVEDAPRAALDALGACYHRIESEPELLDRTVDLLAGEKVVGWFQDRMEFGPRALGARSILGDARSPRMQTEMNLKTKFRESFRPFAPCVLKERASDYFEMRPGEESPYMLLVAPVRESERRSPPPGEAGLEGLQRLPVVRSSIPAVTHVDYSARVQTVDSGRHGRFYRLMKRFEERTGCPVLINTSFNVRSEPIVCTPEDAYRCFLATNMDALVLENFLLLKEEQPAAEEHEIDAYLSRFQLD